MRTELTAFSNIPITTQQLVSLYPTISAPQQKIALLERDGRIIRLKRGLYVVSPNENEVALSKELIANHLYAPSYVSMQAALRFYGLIPERVHVTQSMTVKSSRTFENTLGIFEYVRIARDAFGIGLRIEQADGFAFTIATPEKALCDLIANTSGINLRYLKDVEQYLDEDLRFDMDALVDMNIQILRDYAEVGKKSDSINTLIKYLKR